MPALRRISRDFLAPSGPTLGASASAATFSLQVVQRWGQAHTRSALTLRVDQSIVADQLQVVQRRRRARSHGTGAGTGAGKQI